MAARVLGEVARGIGLDPAAIGPPLVERRIPEAEPLVADPEPLRPSRSRTLTW